MVYQVLDEQNNPIAEHSKPADAQHNAETMTSQHADHYYHAEEVSINRHWWHQLDAILITSISSINNTCANSDWCMRTQIVQVAFRTASNPTLKNTQHLINIQIVTK